MFVSLPKPLVSVRQLFGNVNLDKAGFGPVRPSWADLGRLGQPGRGGILP